MKKYLIQGALALVVSGYLVSCSDHDSEFISYVEVKKAAFEEGFVKFYGAVDPNNDWGFGDEGSSAKTRSVTIDFSGAYDFPTDAASGNFLAAPPAGKSQITSNAASVDGWIDSSWSGELNIWGNNGTGGTIYFKSGTYDFTNRKFYIASNTEVYLCEGAVIKLSAENAANLQEGCNFYMAPNSKIETSEELVLNKGLHIYNHGTIEAGKLSTNSNSILYNSNIVTVNGHISVENTESVIVNDGTITAGSLQTAGSGKFQNNYYVSVSGTTTVNSNNNTWINNGKYITNNFTYKAASNQVVNNCHLIVNNTFHIALGDNPGNGCFRMDSNSGVEAKTFTSAGPFYIFMAGNSSFKVSGTATMNATKADYGIYNLDANSYSVFQAKDIVAGESINQSDGQGYLVTYGGSKLIIKAETHFDSNTEYTSKSGQYPYIDFADGCTKNNIYLNGTNLNGDSSPSGAPTGTSCGSNITPGSNDDDGSSSSGQSGDKTTTRTDIYKIKKVIDHKRVFCEDLGAGAKKEDFDYNDVVFDALILEEYYEYRTFQNGSSSYTSGGTYGNSTYAEITLLAAGGEFPISVGGESVNGKFGYDDSYMINTFGANNNMDSRARHAENIKPVTFKYNFPSGVAASVKNIPIAVKINGDVSILTAMKGAAPQKFCAPVGTRWPNERTAIDAAYGDFTTWTGQVYDDNSNSAFVKANGPWTTNLNTDNMYPNNGASSPLSYGYIYSEEVHTSNYSSTESFSFTDRQGTDIWSNTNGQALSSNAITINKSQFENVAKGTVIRIYGAGESNASISASAGSTALGTKTRASGMNYEYTLSTAQATALKESGLAITGSGFSLYYVTKDISGNQSEPAQQEYTIPARRGTVIWSETPVATTWGSGVVLNTSLFSGAGEGTKIRVYGVGLEDKNATQDNNNSWQLSLVQNIEGWPAVPGIEAQSFWTKGNVEGGVEVEWTLNAEGAAAVKANQTVVRGPNFTVHYVTIDNSAVSTEPTFTPVSGASEIYSTQTALTSEGISINNVDLTNATEVTVTVQGTESGSSSVSVNGVSATKQSARKRTRSATPVTYTATLTGNNIGSSINITGSNFTVYHVYANVTKASSGGGNGTTLWTYENDATYHNDYYIEWGYIAAGKWKDEYGNKKIKIYCTFKSNYFQFKFRLGDWVAYPDNILSSDSNWSLSGDKKAIVASENAGNRTGGYIELNLNPTLVSLFKTNGAYLMDIDQINISTITIE